MILLALSFTVQAATPQLRSSTPTDEAINIAIDANIVLTFKKAVFVQPGANNDISIYLSDGTLVEAIDAQSSAVTGSETKIITVNPASDLLANSNYYVLIGSDAFDSLAIGGDSYPGISNATELNFDTVDTTAPTVTFSPANGATNVSSSSNITLTFSEPIVSFGGSSINNDNAAKAIVTLQDANSSGAIIDFSASIDGTDTVITINPDASFSSLQTVYVTVKANAAEDSSGNVVGTVSATFTAALIVTTPTLSSTSPADGATNISTSANIVLNFNEAVDAESGNIYIKKTDGTIIETISVTDEKVSGSGSTAITINPTTVLDDSTGYYINIDASAFDSSSGGSYAGISNSTTLNFTTADSTAPTVTFSPANGATDVSNNTSIILTFNEAIRYLDDSTIIDNNIGNNIIILKDTNASGTDITFDATISGNVITVNPDASFSSLQTVYVAISNVEDSSDNAISAASVTFTAGNSPHYTSSYPKASQKNIGIDANIVLDFDRVVFASTTSAGGRSDRLVSIYNVTTGLTVFSEDSNNLAISGSGTKQITINPPNDLEERETYCVIIGNDAFYDANSAYYPGISNASSLQFMTAKDPNKYTNVTASNEMHVNHSMSQVEKSIGAIVNRQNFVRRNGGKNTSNQGIKFTFNNPTLDDTLNKLAPLVGHFESYDISRQLANAADKALPNGWGLWTSGEISIGNVNADSGIDSTSKSKEISVGLDKVIDTERMAGGSYRINKTETIIGNDGTQMDSSTKTWSVYGSLNTSERSTLEALIGLGDISTDHTRVDGVNTYTGVRESQQVFACFIARENLHFKETNLSPFIRIDSSYTKQAAYSETGDSDTAYDALHYKSNNFHNTMFSVGVDTDISYRFGDKSVKPYLSLRHKINMGYETSNTMYYLSNPIKEYTDVIASSSSESGFNLVVGADIQSEDRWLITSSYEFSESELIHNKSLRFRAEWKF